MDKSTHQGHCQVCGKIQMLPFDGKLSLHGYKVSGFGFFNGVCQGARELPLQQDRRITDNIITALEAYAARETAAAADLRAGVVRPLTARTGKQIKYQKESRRGTYTAWKDETVPFDQAEPYYQNLAVNRAVADCEMNARHARGHASSLTSLAAAIHGTNLIPVVEEKTAKTLKAGDVLTVGDYGTVTLIERSYTMSRGWSTREVSGWRVRRGERVFFIADATITRALKKGAA